MDEKILIITMDRLAAFSDNLEVRELYKQFSEMYRLLGENFLAELKRLPSLPDMVVDRWERAKMLGFAEGSNIYDNSLVIGDVRVGKECWIGPNTILDGSGDLSIGDFCTISAGVQIYSHDNVRQTLSSKKLPIERKPTSIGNNVYIGPQAVIAKGITIGNNVVIGTFAFVNKDIPDNAIVMGQPAMQVGTVHFDGEGQIIYKYKNR
jgi:acetyltransferase-like isoleucine patch superfamily enzyme